MRVQGVDGKEYDVVLCEGMLCYNTDENFRPLEGECCFFDTKAARCGGQEAGLDCTDYMDKLGGHVHFKEVC